MRYHSITAIVAAEFSAGFKLRPRLVQLTPRAFHLLSRNRNISLTARRSLWSTTPQRAQPAQTALSSEVSTEQDVGRPYELPVESVVDKEKDGIARKTRRGGKGAIMKNRIEQRRAFFIDAMRTVPHPVAVITARRQDVEDDVHGTVAATVSSFNTVCVNPDLIVSFNLKADSTTYKTIIDSNHFTITFPQMTAAGANLVHSFTKGNDPSPFTMEFPDHPTPLPSRWPDDEGVLPPTLKYHPPAVCLTDIENTKESGFAFALLCEYQTSTPVGDHVIVTGRLAPGAIIRMAETGWGAMTSSNYIASHQVTLAHVHGTYSNSDTGLGFASLIRADDQSLSTKLHGVSLDSQIHWCRNRLEVLAGAQRIRRGFHPERAMGMRAPKKQIKLADHCAKIGPELLEEYERYYMQRLQYLEYQAQKQSKDDASSTSETTNPDSEEVTDVPYTELLGHQRLFVRNKMLLSIKELDEEIAMYSMRLSALRIKAKENPATEVLELDSQFAEELVPKESKSKKSSQRDEDGLSRDMQLRRYFLGRIHLLQHAKSRKIELSKPKGKVESPKEETADISAMSRFVGANKSESIVGLKNKYRRFHYQITEAKLSLIGLEHLDEDHPDVPILRERIRYFKPRLETVEILIKERAKSVSTQELLLENFKAPRIRPPDDSEKGSKIKKRNLHIEMVQPILARQLIRSTFPGNVPTDEGDSTDQLDYEDEQQRLEQKNAAIKREAKKLPIGKALSDSTVPPPPTNWRPQVLSAEEEAAEELRQIQEVERDLLRHNANQVRDYLVMQGSEDEEMPSPEDFVDARKLREERLRESEERENNAQSGTAS